MIKQCVIDTEQLPKFEYELGHYSHSKFGCIFVGDEIIYKINDFNEFYKALGYTAEMNSKGILPEEFIWTEYHKDDAKKLNVCLQAKIIDYLFKNKIGFEFHFRKSYKQLISTSTAENLGDCKDCPLANILRNFNN